MTPPRLFSFGDGENDVLNDMSGRGPRNSSVFRVAVANVCLFGSSGDASEGDLLGGGGLASLRRDALSGILAPPGRKNLEQSRGDVPKTGRGEACLKLRPPVLEP
eukprot:CAMPEP_0197705330 /NCGR_PEP_ID=MMETSP1338-20131121/126389_1 /TAXON_ID=43686 ORGANISM="Pelagodinium beii, Strain RCC1491" /NCGR_SAMPLE_ID=MMETSP1338 /ASSEMBLY_ACC=CAM_ASM_000754 /LENGTH=104 /DNA_ID=CAMNT_0043289239 /DNA_START=210 /DNA_END=524 /DNA_ORIENTATION=+